MSTQILYGGQYYVPRKIAASNLLSTRATNIRMLVEAFPKLVDGSTRRFRADIEQDANIGFDQRAERIEEPPVAIELLLILLLQAEYDLHRASTLRYLASICNDDM